MTSLAVILCDGQCLCAQSLLESVAQSLPLLSNTVGKQFRYIFSIETHVFRRGILSQFRKGRGEVTERI